MFFSFEQLRSQLETIIKDKTRQGHETSGLAGELRALPDSFDALYTFARTLAALPLRGDWPHIEPNDWPGILAELSPERPKSPIGSLTSAAAADRVRAAFLGSVVGCMLGKPIEINPTLTEIEAALTPFGEWPLRNYITRAAAHNFPRGPHPDWPETVRENLHFVAPDDDINYTLLGMLILETHGHFPFLKNLKYEFRRMP